MLAIALCAVVMYLLPAFLPWFPGWNLTLPYIAPVALFVAIWPRRIRDGKWTEGDLIRFRFARSRKRGRWLYR
jgi:hypothetical protein